MRVRWALGEVGQPYDVRLLSFSEMKESAHRMLHPFGQIPTYEEGDLALFESEAIYFISPRAMRGYCQTMRMPARAMVTVLRRLNGSGMLEQFPNLSIYIARGEARPASVPSTLNWRSSLASHRPG